MSVNVLYRTAARATGGPPAGAEDNPEPEP
jgi:hypothetical protein